MSVPEKIADAVGLLKITIITDKSLPIYAVISAANMPSGAPSPPGDVFSCFEIVFTKYGTTQKVEPRGYIEFKVPKSWLSETGHKPEDIVLMKLSGDKWIELKTEITGEDSGYVYYKAEVGSFSIFAVVAKAAAVVTPTVTPTAVPTVAPTKTPTATPTTPAPSKPFEWTWIAAAIVVIVILLLVVAYFTRRK